MPDPSAASSDLDAVARHFAAGHWEKVERLCAQIIARNPRTPRAWHLRGAAAVKDGKTAAAIEHFRRANLADPAYPDALPELIKLYRKLNRPADAAACTIELARLRQDDYFLQCEAARLLVERADYVAAEAHARKAVALRPDDPNGYVNLGAALQQQNRLEEAQSAYARALAIDPDSAVTHSNLSDLYGRLGRLSDAEASARRAIALGPVNSDYHNNLATALGRQDRFEESLAAARQAIALNKDNFRAHATASLALLMLGRFAEGWPEYEWRVGAFGGAPTGRRTWDGSDLRGKSIVLRSEQGYGDAIQFIRYAPLLKEQRGAGRVLVECAPAMTELLKRADGVDEVFTWGGPTARADVELWIMSLPHRFATSVETIPAHMPYLRHDPARAERLRPRVKDGDFNIGIVWAGNPQHMNDLQRSCPLAKLAPLTRLDGVRLCSLQKGAPAERDAGLVGELDMTDLGGACENFADLAAAMSLLDLVISVDTAPAHLAGALARPVWTMLPHVAEWRWLRERPDSPWYPTMRLFRQPGPGDWDWVVAAMVEALRRELTDRVHSPRT